jgi:pilus assembly protein FimV
LEAEPLFAAELEESEQVTGLEEDEVPAVALETFGMEIEVEAEPEADFEEPEEEPVQGEDDPEIKLDLARAYLSLGDKEASKSMLDEVIKSGNEAQKAEARQMLEEL